MHIKSVITATLLILASFAADASTSATSTLDEKSKSRTVGVNIEPIYILIGGIGVKVDYFATEKFSFGIRGVRIQDKEIGSSDSSSSLFSTSYRFSHTELDLNTRFMLTGTNVSDGAYFSPSVGYISSRIYDYGIYRLEGGLSTPVATLMLGYQFVNPQSGFRLNAGLGYRLAQANTIEIKNKAGNVIHSDKSSSLDSMAFELGLGMMF